MVQKGASCKRLTDPSSLTLDSGHHHVQSLRSVPTCPPLHSRSRPTTNSLRTQAANGYGPTAHRLQLGNVRASESARHPTTWTHPVSLAPIQRVLRFRLPLRQSHGACSCRSSNDLRVAQPLLLQILLDGLLPISILIEILHFVVCVSIAKYLKFKLYPDLQSFAIKISYILQFLFYFIY